MGSPGSGGSGGTASGGDTNTSGGSGGTGSESIGGGGSGAGGAAGTPNGGAGGSGAGSTGQGGGGGGGGGLSVKTYTAGQLTVGAGISVVVGTGGGGGAGGAGSCCGYTPGNPGTAGTAGSVVVTWVSPVTTITGNVKIASNLNVRGSISKGSGTFVIDHPTSPRTKLLYHSFVESPDAKNIYDGVVKLNALGEATIQLPEYFEALNEDFRYQYFPLYEPMPGLYIKKEIKNNEFTIAGGAPRGEVSWQVTGVRHDPYIIANPIRVEVEKGPAELVDKGEYIFPDYEKFAPAPH